jgi:hypothetical protein
MPGQITEINFSGQNICVTNNQKKSFARETASLVMIILT